MAAWKIFLFQASLLKTQYPQLLDSHKGRKVLDIDVSTLVSCSSKKEGKAEILPKANNIWLLRRLIGKMERIKIALIDQKSIA